MIIVNLTETQHYVLKEYLEIEMGLLDVEGRDSFPDSFQAMLGAQRDAISCVLEALYEAECVDS